MSVKNIIFLTLLSYLLCSYGYAEVKSVQLLKNPFVKPEFIKTKPETKRINVEESRALSERSLRATLFSRQDSIANIDGMMFYVGDKVKGYELIAVGEGYVTLVKDEKKITLYVSEKHKQLR